jgi:hypothetical protein
MPARLPILLLALATLTAGAAPAIDRQALVTRHNPRNERVDFDAPLSVGNGGFAFTADITGLQTFPDEYYRDGIPIETMARWAWQTESNPQGYQLADANQPYRQADGRTVEYPTRTDSPAAAWLRRNPHARALAQIGLDWRKPDGGRFESRDVEQPHQSLDLWSGTLTSEFSLGGERVAVTTMAHPELDAVAVRLVSRLLGSDALAVRIAFPRGYDLAIKNTPPLDWTKPGSYRTERLTRGAGITAFRSQVDEATYEAVLRCGPRDELATVAPHIFRLRAAPGATTLEFTVRFTPDRAAAPPPGFDETVRASAAHWADFWSRSAALDLRGSSNPLAPKLERRVVLSQYLTAIQCAGGVPPQETGLTCSTWYGKHHTEMIWWHTAHFALWGHPELLTRNVGWYVTHLPDARAIAGGRGLRGARWPKMVGPEGRESPGGNPLIVWNQPHPIYLGELLYRLEPTPATLQRYRALVFETAAALADMVWLDPQRGAYVLGPPLWIAQEIHDPATSHNPAFELAYWRWALEVAQRWHERLGEPRERQWDDVIRRLAPLPQQGGRYVALESHPDTWTNLASRHDHPEMLMALGFLPATPAVDASTMSRTLDAVLEDWDWETKIWGWDYPMIAMTATRLGRPADAVEVLLRDGPGNRYAPNGHCPQRSDQAQPAGGPPLPTRRREIAVYLPANGAFLSAVALMVAGWDGCDRPHPGFPADGTWHIRAEGWQPLP